MKIPLLSADLFLFRPEIFFVTAPLIAEFRRNIRDENLRNQVAAGVKARNARKV